MEVLQELKKREDEAHDLFVMTVDLLRSEIERADIITLNEEEVVALLHCVRSCVRYIRLGHGQELRRILVGPVMRLVNLQESFDKKQRK